jgi:hypothetical protein
MIQWQPRHINCNQQVSVTRAGQPNGHSPRPASQLLHGEVRLLPDLPAGVRCQAAVDEHPRREQRCQLARRPLRKHGAQAGERLQLGGGVPLGQAPQVGRHLAVDVLRGRAGAESVLPRRQSAWSFFRMKGQRREQISRRTLFPGTQLTRDGTFVESV